MSICVSALLFHVHVSFTFSENQPLIPLAADTWMPPWLSHILTPVRHPGAADKRPGIPPPDLLGGVPLTKESSVLLSNTLTQQVGPIEL